MVGWCGDGCLRHIDSLLPDENHPPTGRSGTSGFAYIFRVLCPLSNWLALLVELREIEHQARKKLWNASHFRIPYEKPSDGISHNGVLNLLT
jgi:hypothetical protein